MRLQPNYQQSSLEQQMETPFFFNSVSHTEWTGLCRACEAMVFQAHHIHHWRAGSELQHGRYIKAQTLLHIQCWEMCRKHYLKHPFTPLCESHSWCYNVAANEPVTGCLGVAIFQKRHGCGLYGLRNERLLTYHNLLHSHIRGRKIGHRRPGPRRPQCLLKIPLECGPGRRRKYLIEHSIYC